MTVPERTHLTEHGFRRLSAVPTEEKLATYYRDKYFQENQGGYASDYDEAELRYIEVVLNRKLAALRRFAPEVPDTGRLLDVGFGEGHCLSRFAAMGWSVSGVDFSDAALRAHHPEFADRVEVGDVVEALEHAVSVPSQFEVIWLDNVLEHVLDPQRLLELCRQLMSPTSALVVEVPNDYSPAQVDLASQGLIDDESWVFEPDHVSYFNKAGLASLADAVGLVERGVIADFPIDWFLYHPGSNYYRKPSAGRTAHRARIHLELLIARQSADAVLDLFEALAACEAGRQIVAVFSAT